MSGLQTQNASAAAGKIEVVSGDDRGEWAIGGGARAMELLDEPKDQLGGATVQVTRRFIGHQEARTGTRGRAQATTCCSPTGNPAGRMGSAAGETNLLQPGVAA